MQENKKEKDYMKLIKNGDKVIGLLFANDVVPTTSVSGDYLASVDVEEDVVELDVVSYIKSVVESNSQYDKFGDLRVVELEHTKGVKELELLFGLSKDALEDRIQYINDDLAEYDEYGLEPFDCPRVEAVLEVLGLVYEGILNLKGGK